MLYSTHHLFYNRLYQVRSASGKTMLVERSKLRKLMAMEGAKVAVKNKDGNNVGNKAGNDVGNNVGTDITPSVGKSLEKKPTIPGEIFLDDDDGDGVEERDVSKNSLNLEKPEIKVVDKEVSKHGKDETSETIEKSNDDPVEILLADDEEDEVRIDQEVVLDCDTTGVKRKYEMRDFESKRIRKTTQG